MAKYISGRQSQLNVGVTSSTESKTVLQVTGKVGIGTTNAGSRSLYVIGDTQTTGVTTLASAGGITTTGGDLFVGGDLYVADDLVFDELTARNANFTGITTIRNANITGIATIASIAGTGATITNLNVSSGIVTNLLGVAVTFTNGQIVNLTGTAATIANLNVSSGIITNLTGVAATITSITGIAATINRIVSAATSFSQLQVSGISTFTNGPVFIGSGTTTGTADQKLQVTGGAFVSGTVGVGTTNPTSALHVIGDVLVTGVVTATTFNGNINTGVATITTATITDLTNTRLTSGIGTINNLTSNFNNTGVGTINILNTGIGTINNLNNTLLNVSGIASIATLHSPSASINVGVITDLTNTRFTSGVSTITDIINTRLTSGVGTITNLTGTNATLIRIDSTHINAGIITANQLSTGASGVGININNNSITGPSSIVIDPAGVGDNTGAVRIKGDLYIDGDQFYVNSGTIELADLRVGIATTVGSNMLLDGGGIGIGSTNILKTFTYNYASDSLKSSENLDIALSKTYKIDGTDVLSSNTLGSGVIYSSLQYLGNLNNLNVSGLSTLPTLVGTYATITEINNTRFLSGISSITNLYVSNGYINVGVITDLTNTRLTSGISTITNLDVTREVVGISTITNLYVSNGYINVGVITDLTNTRFTSGISSITDLYTSNGYINVGVVTDLTNTRLSSGIATITTLDSSTGSINNLTNNLLNTGIGSIATLYSSNAYINSGIVTDISGTRLNYTGVGTITTLDSSTGTINNLTNNLLNTGIGSIATFYSSNSYINVGVVTDLTNTRLTSGIATITTLDGTHTNLTDLNVSGISTQNIVRASTLNVSGVGTIATINSINIVSTNSDFTNLNADNGYIVTGIITDISNTRLTSGIATVTTLDATTASIVTLSGTNVTYTNSDFTNLNANNAFVDVGIVTDISGTRLTYTGVGTITTLDTDTAIINNLTSDYINVGVATATILNSGIGTINNLNNTLLNVSGVATITTLNTTNVTSTNSDFTNLNANNAFIDVGIVTDLTNTRLTSGIATVTTLNSTQSNLTNINSSGISTLGVTSVTDLTAQQLNVSGISTFQSGNLKIRNPANTFEYTIAGGAITADRILTLPVVTSNTGIAVTGLNQSFTGTQTFSGLTVTGTFNHTGGSGTLANNGTATATANIATGTLASGISKTINFGTGGASGSFTQISVGPTAGVGTVLVNTGTNLGIGSATPTSKLDVVGDAKFTGVVTATTFVGALTGTAASATQLATPRTFEITGDIVASPISFDGTGNVSLAATIQPNSVALGTDTTGDYVTNITGTSNQITVTGGTGEGSTPTLSLPTNLVLPQDVTVTRDLQVNRNLNVTGNITIGGTTAFVNVQELVVTDPDIILGYRTDAFGNDVSNDNTANHGGIGLASTEGSPLVQLFIAGIETAPATYKKIMWFKSGTFTGLNTDAWLSNYAVGIGSTQFPVGTRLAAGSVQFTENDLAVVRNINASGVSTLGVTTFTGAVSFGTSAYFGDNDSLYFGDSNDLQIYHNSSNNNSIIEESGSGNLILRGGNVVIQSNALETCASFITNGAVELYFDNSKKFETTGYGATVFGTLQAQGLQVNSGVSTLGITTATNLTTQNINNSGITTTNSLNIGATQVISSGRQLQNIASLDATTTATIESAIANAPNTFADLNVTGISTLGVTSATNLTVQQLNVSGVSTHTGISTFQSTLFGTQASFSGVVTAATFNGQINAGVGTITTLSGTTATYTTGSFTNGNIVTGVVTTLTSTNATLTNINSSGISTLGITSATNLTARQLNVSGVSTCITLDSGTLYADTGYIDNLSMTYSINLVDSDSLGIFRGIRFGYSNDIEVSYDGAVTDDFIINFAAPGGPGDLIAIANNGTYKHIITKDGKIGINTSVKPTVELFVSGNGRVTGVLTASSFSGNASSATYATNAGVATYATSSGIATYATTAGIATYASIAGIATYATTAGIATYATTAGVSTNVIGGIASVTSLNVSGVSTLGVTTFTGTVSFGTSAYFGDNDILYFGDGNDLQIYSDGNNSFIREVSGTGGLTISGNIFSLQSANGETFFFGTQNGAVELYYDNSKEFETTGYGATVFGILQAQGLQVSGVSTLGTVQISSGIVTATSGLVTYYGDGSKLTNIQASSIIGIVSYATNATYAISAGIATYATTAGIATYATTAGIATYATTAGVSTSVIGGIGSITQLQVTGVSTFTNGPVFIGAATSTGTASQPLQVTGGAYVSGSVGIGSTSPSQKLDVAGNIKLTGAIYGPAELIIDPAAVGDNTGAVRIKGDLYVDGTQTYINSTTIELADFNVGIATTVGTNALLDGAGIGIGSTNIRKTINWNNTLSALSSSENWNLTSGKNYKIGGTDVLTSTTLGTTVVNSSLTSVGTLGQLNVSGVSTFTGAVSFGTSAYFGDNDIAYFGDGNDLNVYHDGTNSYIADYGVGRLVLASNGAGVDIIKAPFENIASFNTDGSVELYYDNSKEFETTGYGATVFGILQTQGLQVNSGVSTVGFLTATSIWNAGITTSARITLNGANSTTTGGGQIYLNGATGNRIDFNTNGVAAPSFTTRSAGTKIVLFPNISGSQVDYGLGIESFTLWYSVPQNLNTFQHRWYGGTTQLADLKGTGELVIGSASLTGTASQRLQVTGGGYISTNLGIGSTNPQYLLDVNGNINFNGLLYQNNQPFIASRWSAGLGNDIYRMSQVGIGTTNPAYDLDVLGDVRIRGGLYDDINNSAGLTNYVVVANGAGGWSWQPVTASGAGTLDGIEIRDQGNVVGTSGSITTLDFRCDNTNNLVVTGYAGGSIATISLSNDPIFSTLGVLNSSGLGIATANTLQVGGIVTFTNGPVLIGSGNSTGTTSQTLQVTGGGYVSGSLGIGTTNPQYKLDVAGDLNFNGNLYQNGSKFTSGIGIGSTSVNPISGVITPAARIGIGFTDINFVGTGLSVTGYGSTVVIDFGNLGGAVSISTVSPGISTAAGNLWWDSTVGDLKIYYNDGNSAQWVDANGGSSVVTISESAPAGALNGDLWWDSTYGILKVYYDDGSSSQWVDANSGAYINYWISTSAGIHTTGNVGVGTTIPNEKLQVDGYFSIDNRVSYGTTIATTSSTSQVGIHSALPIATYRSVEYTIQATQGTNFHTTKIIALHDGSLAYPTEYGSVYNTAAVATYDVDVSGGNMRLLTTPASSSTTTYKIIFDAIKV